MELSAISHQLSAMSQAARRSNGIEASAGSSGGNGVCSIDTNRLKPRFLASLSQRLLEMLYYVRLLPFGDLGVDGQGQDGLRRLLGQGEVPPLVAQVGVAGLEVQRD